MKKKTFRHSKIQDAKRFKWIKKNQKLSPFDKFVTEVLIFRSSCSQMLFKIGVLKNFKILEPLPTGLLLQNTHSGCFWIFAAANTFFQLNFVFIAYSHTGFCSGLRVKHELNLRSSHWSCSVKKRCSWKFCKLHRNTLVLKFLFHRVADLQAYNFIKKRLQHKYFPVDFTKFLRKINLKSANNCF